MVLSELVLLIILTFICYLNCYSILIFQKFIKFLLSAHSFHFTIVNSSKYWQNRNLVALVRMYLTPGELAVLDFQSSTAPTSAAEPLLSEIRLSEQECRTVAPKAIAALDQAKIKMVDTF